MPDVEPYWQACQKDLQTLLTRAHTGEPVRIWYDHTPASLCGLARRCGPAGRCPLPNHGGRAPGA